MTEEESNGWRPEVGDTVSGRVVEVVPGDNGYGTYPIVVLQTDKGEVAVHAFHTVLRNELARRRPKRGDEISVTYVGKKASKDARGDFHHYRVSGGQLQQYDWNQDLPEDQRQPAPAAPDVPIEMPQATTAAALVPDAEDDVPF